MSIMAPLLLVAAATVVTGSISPAQDDSSQNPQRIVVGHNLYPEDGFGGQPKPYEDGFDFVRFSFPGGSVDQYIAALKAQIDESFEYRWPINILPNKNLKDFTLPAIDIVVPVEQLPDIGIGVICNVRFEVGPDIYGVINPDQVNEWVVRLSGRFWEGDTGWPEDYASSIESLIASRDDDSHDDSYEDDMIETRVFPVINVGVMEAAEAISSAITFSGLGESSEIMAHESTNTILFRGNSEAQFLAMQVLEAAEKVKESRITRDEAESTIFEEGIQEGMERMLERMEAEAREQNEKFEREIEALQDQLAYIQKRYSDTYAELQSYKNGGSGHSGSRP